MYGCCISSTCFLYNDRKVSLVSGGVVGSVGVAGLHAEHLGHL